MFYDIRKSEGISEIISLENNNLNISSLPFSLAGVRYVDKGIGFVSGVKYSDSMLEKAKKLAKLSESRIKFPETDKINKKLKPSFKENPIEIPLSERSDLVKEIASMANGKNVSYTNVILSVGSGKKQYTDSHGSNIETPTNAIILYVRISGGDSLQTAYFSLGTLKGYEVLRKTNFKKEMEKLVRRHEQMISAKKAPAGRYPVVLNPVLTGVFFHEAVGHACEADAVLNNASVLRNKIGKKIASDAVSMYDDPRVKGFGHYKYDDEGIKARETELIKDGFLIGL